MSTPPSWRPEEASRPSSRDAGADRLARRALVQLNSSKQLGEVLSSDRHAHLSAPRPGGAHRWRPWSASERDLHLARCCAAAGATPARQMAQSRCALHDATGAALASTWRARSPGTSSHQPDLGRVPAARRNGPVRRALLAPPGCLLMSVASAARLYGLAHLTTMRPWRDAPGRRRMHRLTASAVLEVPPTLTLRTQSARS